MTFASMFKAATALSLAGLLAACGGGGNSASPTGSGAAPAPELPAVAWASPAVFVTPGAASKSFAMENCTRSGNVYTNTTSQNIPSSSLYTASLVITSSGDISMKAATTVTGAISTLWATAFANMQNAAWSVSGTTQTPSYTINGGTNGRSEYQYFNIYSTQGESNINLNSYSGQRDSSTDSYTNTYASIQCNLIDPLALQVNVDAARAAKNLGTAAGVDTFDNYDVPGRIEGGKAFWADSGAMPQFKNLRFDLATGELASNPSTTGTYSSLSLSLPTADTQFGSYGESLQRNSSSFSYKDAKGICLSKTDTNAETSFSVNAFAYGNRFYPVRGNNRYYGPEERNEVTLASRESSCNNYFD